DQDRAGAALAAVAAGLGAGEPDHLPQVVEQQQVVGNRVDAPAAVQVELEDPRHLRAVRRGPAPFESRCWLSVTLVVGTPGTQWKACGAFTCPARNRESIGQSRLKLARLESVHDVGRNRQ